MNKLPPKSELSENFIEDFDEKAKNTNIKKITEKISSFVSEIIDASDIKRITSIITSLILILIPNTILAEDNQDELMAKIISTINISTIKESNYAEINNNPIMQNGMQKNNPNKPSNLEVAFLITEEFGPSCIKKPIKKIQGTIDKLKLKFSLQKKIGHSPQVETSIPPKNKELDKEENSTFLDTISKIISIQIGDKISAASKPNILQQALGIKEFGYDTSFSYDSSDNSLKAKATFDLVTDDTAYNSKIVLEKSDYSVIFTMPFDSTVIEKILD